MKTIQIAQFGVGPIGLETLRAAAGKPWAEIIGAVDVNPRKIGKDLGKLTGMPQLRQRFVHSSLEQLLRVAKPDVIFHTAVSKFKTAFGQLDPIARHGINVVSSCEELVFPQLREPTLARRLDQVCRRSGARIVGTGVNPGFVMDLLPLCLTGVSCRLNAVHVQRVVNASTRRESLQRKIGSGMAPNEFAKQLRQGQAGHAGLKESLALVANRLGWKLKSIAEWGEAVVAERDIETEYLRVKKGQACGLHQRAEGRVGGKVAISLDLSMYLDAPNPHDAIQIEGDPRLQVVLAGGIAGDQATVAALVNAAPRLLAARPGLLLVTDLTVPRFM